MKHLFREKQSLTRFLTEAVVKLRIKVYKFEFYSIKKMAQYG